MKNLMEIEEVKELKGNENAIAKLALRRCLERIRKQPAKIFFTMIVLLSALGGKT